MDVSTSECSSGCESGWTMYFDQYSGSADQCNRSFSRPVGEGHRSGDSRIGQPFVRSKGGAYIDIDQEEEDEDLSMVSDASSGPPHFHEDESYFVQTGNISYTSPPSEKRKGKHKKNGKGQNSYLDDTASSPVVSFSKHVPSFSQGLSATDPKEKSTLRKHFGFLNPSVKGKAASEKSGGLQGRKKW